MTLISAPLAYLKPRIVPASPDQRYGVAAAECAHESTAAHKETHGEEVSTGEASAMTHRLLALYKLLSQPLPGEVEKPSPRSSLGCRALLSVLSQRQAGSELGAARSPATSGGFY